MSVADVHVPAPSREVRLHFVAWVLVGVAAWDGAGLVYAGPDVTSSQSYAALELVPGGMRTWGVLLLIGACAVAWGIGKDGRGNPRVLNRVLAGGVAYYGLWTVVLPGTWLWIGLVPAWGAPSKTAALALLYFACARAAAPGRRATSTGRTGSGAHGAG